MRILLTTLLLLGFGSQNVFGGENDKLATTDAANVTKDNNLEGRGKIAAGAKVKPHLLRASRKRDETAAKIREAEILLTKKLRGMDQSLKLLDIQQILCLDFHRPDLHVLAAEIGAKSTGSGNRPTHQVEAVFQEYEYLRLANAADSLLSRAEAACKTLPDRQSVIPPATLLEKAKNSFKAGLGMHIDYTGESPLVMEETGLERFLLPIRYIRSPGLPPRGCRIRVDLLISRGGKDVLITRRTGYQPCAFEMGGLYGDFFSFGDLRAEEPPVMLIYATTQFEDKDTRPAIISNVLAIPVVSRSLQRRWAAPTEPPEPDTVEEPSATEIGDEADNSLPMP